MTTTALLLALVATAAPVAHVVWIVEDNDAPLFEDELDRVKDALSQSVEQQFPERFVGVRAADERRARSLVENRQLKQGGPRCAEAPSLAEALAVAHPNVLEGRLVFSCTEGSCSVQATVYGERYAVHEEPPRKVLFERTITVLEPKLIDRWLSLVSEATNAWAPRAPPAAEGFLMGALGGMVPSGLSLRSAHGFGVSVTDAQLQKELKQAGKCTEEFTRVVLELSPSGGVSRCEAASSCACGAFSKLRLEKGDAGRRVVLETQWGHPSALDGALGLRGTGSGRVFGLGGAGLGSSDPNAVARVSSSRSSYDEDPSRLSDRAKLLARCFGKGRKAARFEVRSVLSSTGKPTSTRAAGRDLTDAERACVEKVAGAFSYRCPDAEGDEAAVEFSVWSGP